MAKIISSQRYLDSDTVAAKSADGDFVVSLSPEFDLDGDTYQVVLDGHHRLAAAEQMGATPEYVVLTVADCDAIRHLEQGDVEAFLEAVQNESDWYNVATGRNIW